MYKIVIVEDEARDSRELKEFLDDYSAETGNVFDIQIFSNPLVFFGNYNTSADLLFLDIEMPEYNGMEAARKIREKDDGVTIIFVSNLSQYAVAGYSVDALDFIVKPMRYVQLRAVMNKALRTTEYVNIKNIEGIQRISVDEILYVEVQRHRLFYHLIGGRVVDNWGILSEVYEVLPQRRFAKCNNCYVVNLHFVRGVEGDFVDVGGEKLKISRAKKKEFMDKLVSYIGTERKR